MSRGPSTRAAHAGLPAPEQGAPFLPGPVLAAPFHLAGDVGDVRRLQPRREPDVGAVRARAGRVRGRAMSSSSPPAWRRCTPRWRRRCARRRPRRAERRLPGRCAGSRATTSSRAASRSASFRPTTRRCARRCPARTSSSWSRPSNPALDVLDLAAIARDTDATVVVDNTLAGPLHQPVLALGADLAVVSATKYLTGHSDINMGYVATRDAGRLRALARADGRAARARSRPGWRTARWRLAAAPRAPDGQRARAGGDARASDPR